MITSIKLENFKCFREVEVNPRLITVFVGPNGSGKSSVLQAMALLKQSLGLNKLRLRGDLLNLNDSHDIVPKFQEIPETIHLEFEGGITDSSLSGTGFGDYVRYRYEADFKDTALTLYSGEIVFTYRRHRRSVKVSSRNIFTESMDFEYGIVTLRPVSKIADIVEVTAWSGQSRPQQRCLR